MPTKTRKNKMARVRTLTPKEAKKFFEREALRRLKMSGEEFIRKWDTGQFNGKSNSAEVLHVAMLLPFGR